MHDVRDADMQQLLLFSTLDLALAANDPDLVTTGPVLSALSLKALGFPRGRQTLSRGVSLTVATMYLLLLQLFCSEELWLAPLKWS